MSYTKEDLWEEHTPRKKYVIKAGVNKTGRQMYLITWVDSDEWTISAVPFVMGKVQATRLIKRVEKELIEIREKYPRKYPKDMTFELEEYEQKYSWQRKEQE